MRSTKMVSVWPVAFVGEILVERPIVRNGKVEGFVAMYDPSRPFPIDMAAFAVNIQLVLDKPNLIFDYEVKRGYQESHFLQPLVKRSQLEPKASNCTEVLVWHTRTMMPMLHLENKLKLLSTNPMNSLFDGRLWFPQARFTQGIIFPFRKSQEEGGIYRPVRWIMLRHFGNLPYFKVSTEALQYYFSFTCIASDEIVHGMMELQR
ncbi:hypothetical protein M513_13991 [Trichuris suis]|uniref:Galactosylgalactosylxylosylprotein 3-beta-glucuronosyltransferase n=1 Tax=Trichuris suis TaxID=68888 RepID=A0A085LJI6_9BILA|nr:hypothetical protein M513_13991 [Trichuris suis]